MVVDSVGRGRMGCNLCSSAEREIERKGKEGGKKVIQSNPLKRERLEADKHSHVSEHN